MSAKLKAGVIGLGMGRGHLSGYLSHPDVEVVAAAKTAVRFFPTAGRNSRAKSTPKASR